MSKSDYQISYSLKRKRNYKIFKVFVFIILLISLITIIQKYFIFPVKQTSISMEPDLPQNSYVLISEIGSNYKRGDLVLLQPENKINSTNLKCIANFFIKFFTAQQISLDNSSETPGLNEKIRRIVCVPGDTFYMKDYVLYIRPQGEKHFLTEFEIAPKSYNISFTMPQSNWDSSLGVSGSFDEITLKANEYFVLSDLRISSDDSRLWGAITKENIKGKAILLYFPFQSFKLY